MTATSSRRRYDAYRDEQRRKADDHLERTSVEMGGPIPARFKHLQYLNEERDKRV